MRGYALTGFPYNKVQRTEIFVAMIVSRVFKVQRTEIFNLISRCAFLFVTNITVRCTFKFDFAYLLPILRCAAPKIFI